MSRGIRRGNPLGNLKTRKLRQIIAQPLADQLKKWELSQYLKGKTSTIIFFWKQVTLGPFYPVGFNLG